jgi:voltage-gated sodium channel
MFDQVRKALESTLAERVIIMLIVINAITLGLETSRTVMAHAGTLLQVIDHLILGIFVVELLLRIIVHRMNFFRDPWSVFDLLVVGIALVPANGSLSVLRSLRILRVLRLVTVVPPLRRVVGGLVSALPGMGSIMVLVLLIFYVFSVMATKLFGATHEGAFGTLGTSALTLFQVMTFDNWSGGVLKPLMSDHPYAIAFIVLFIVIANFTALNLFIGVVVSALDAESHGGTIKARPIERRLLEEMSGLRRDIAALEQRISSASSSASSRPETPVNP